MRRVVYLSRSLVQADDAVLDAIVDVSVRRNAAVGIGGILWSGRGEFVQALEGGHDEVQATLQRIAADARHTDLEIICDCTVQSRMFGAWAMVRSDQRVECTMGTAYLFGYLAEQRSPAARRVVEVLLQHDDR